MSTTLPYQFHSHFIFRTPTLPFQLKKKSKEDFLEFTKSVNFKESIYLASPVLYDELIKWHRGELKEEKEVEKLIISLYKYYSRMQSRCTPYGLFAGCSTGQWSDKNEISLSDVTPRDTRLDMNYLCALAQKLNAHPVILPVLLFYPNNSIYAFGGALRYIEYRYINNRRVHQITSVDDSDILQLILNKAKQGAKITELATLLLSDDINEDGDITIEAAEEFVKELIDSQILVSELEPAVTGDEFIYQIIQTLKKLNASLNNPEVNSIIQLLEKTEEQIKTIDTKIGNDVDAYRTIYEQLKALNTTIEENQLFQTDLYKKTASSVLNVSIQKQLQETIVFLNKFFPNGENGNLKKFRENYYKQYETTELPLLEVLDTETGIGYISKDTSGVNHLLDDMFIPGAQQQSYEIRWNRPQEILHERLFNAAKTNEYSITLTDEDLKKMDNSSKSLPDTFPIMFRLIDHEKIYFQSCGGSSAANLLGRFAHGSDEIHSIIKDITTREQEINNDKILAEIVHLPESRIGNILLRPVLRNYEIPYLGKSALPLENQLPLEDLMVSVRNERIILRSKRLNKEIIPRLSSAHNFSFNALPAYQFLCDLQTQYFEKPGVGFNWGSLSNNFKFLPRAEYKGVILERAKWQLAKDDFKILLEDKKDDYPKQVNEWLKQWNIPQYVVLVDSDNELLVNFDDAMSLKMFVSAIKKRDRITLEEFLFDTTNLLVKDNSKNGYTNEFIAVLLKDKIVKEEAYQPVAATKNKTVKFEEDVQRDFSIGSEWLYYKLYCGVKTGDKLLANIIKPLTEELLENKLINEFFFIRYSDPDLHIRLRFLIKDETKLGDVIITVNKYLQSYLKEGLITKVQTDSYKRELERYGANSITLAESFFFIDSVATLNLLSLIEGDTGEQIRWQFALRSVDELLNSFKYNTSAKLFLLERLKTGFTQEHGGSKELKLQLDTKFRNVRKQVEEFLNSEFENKPDFAPLKEVLDNKAAQLATIAQQILELKDQNQLQVELNDLMASYSHMLLNRIFKARQRTFEMLIYDLLYRHYKSMAAREKSAQKVKETN